MTEEEIKIENAYDKGFVDGKLKALEQIEKYFPSDQDIFKLGTLFEKSNGADSYGSGSRFVKRRLQEAINKLKHDKI